MIDINNFDTITIGLASSKQIRSWSSGEVTKPETINYRTLKPEKDGLFCERIFGPTKDWECYCGKYKRVRYKGIVCERCGVEVTRSKVRRERMGHVDLAAPVSHIWFFKGVPSRIGYLLDMAPKELEKVLYFAASIVTWVDDEARQKDLDSLEKEVQKVLDSYAAEREERVLELKESQERREDYLNTGNQKNFSDDDHMWAEALDIQPKKLTDEDREKQLKDLKKTFDSDISDTEAYIEDAAERMRQVWDLFRDMKPKDVIPDETVFRELKDRFGSPFGFGEYFRGGMGAEAVRDLLQQVDLDAEREDLEEQVRTAKGQKQSRAVKRLRVVSAFIHSDNKPEHMTLEAIPVIPPELRPMVQLDGGRFAPSDLNDLSRRVINRNNRLKRLLDLGAPEIIVNNEKRMLQEAVDALFDNGRRGRAVTGPGNRALKSLSDMLKGKQGRFRQNLLGKRVDYSGRSVIVSGPTLKLHQCGLPKLMALELFKPFIMSRLVERKAVQNIKAAKKMVDSMIPEVWDVLEEVIHEHPVLLNRAPTLHRLGIQAFEPVLVEGKAIQVHPLVCHAFNADFDGDQMAVHLPLSAEAQAEARILMLSANNILSPAHGRPLTTPTQDMVLGEYYLTYSDRNLNDLKAEDMDPRPKRFSSEEMVERAVEDRQVGIQQAIEYRHGEELVVTTPGRVILNAEVERSLRESGVEGLSELPFLNRTLSKKETDLYISDLAERFGAHVIAAVLDKVKTLGFRYATKAGITVSKNDIVIPQEKEELLAGYEEKVSNVEGLYERGLITEEERHEQIVNLWTEATEDVAQAMEKNLLELNPIFMMANSGARGSFKQIRQLAGMRGLMANPKGEIIERPIKANFMEGLSVLEYFISTHGARKGGADTALRTADSGYLTRRLVDVSQDVIIREEDCKTKDGVHLPLHVPEGVNPSLLGRSLAEDLHKPLASGKPGKTVVAERGTIVSNALLDEIVEAFTEHELEEEPTISVRSVLKCKSEYGVCRACYGIFLATGGMCEIGDAVGIIAAQSIGEPGTQLTMRTFHTGGVAGADITHGLPRVVEIFEARNPKGAAKLAEVGGRVEIEDTDRGPKLTVHTDEVDENGEPLEPVAYQLPRRTRVLVENGQVVDPGDPLHEGSINPADLLRLKGSTAIELYLVAEVQKVYKSQGVDIHDKHIELIVRQMLKKVRVEEAGDTDLLPGQLVDRVVLERENVRVKKEKGKKEQATYEPLILGITKASLATESFLSAASFQETTKVLTDASIEGKIDRLLGLKENVIIGKLIPAATGLKKYRNIDIGPSEKVPKETYEREALLAALQEIGSDGGDGIDLASLGLDFGGEPQITDGESTTSHEAGEAEEVPEVDTPLDGD